MWPGIVHSEPATENAGSIDVCGSAALEQGVVNLRGSPGPPCYDPDRSVDQGAAPVWTQTQQTGACIVFSADM
jgi:hypothetical protein